MKCCSCHQGKGKDSSPCFIIDGASSGIVAFLAVLVHPHTMQNQTLFFFSLDIISSWNYVPSSPFLSTQQTKWGTWEAGYFDPQCTAKESLLVLLIVKGGLINPDQKPQRHCHYLGF